MLAVLAVLAVFAMSVVATSVVATSVVAISVVAMSVVAIPVVAIPVVAIPVVAFRRVWRVPGTAAVRPGRAAPGWSSSRRRPRRRSAGAAVAARPGARPSPRLPGPASSDACSSPSAVMTRARRSRSASAWRAIDRFIESGSTTSLISTRSMCTPQPSAGLSIINSRPWLRRSRLDSRSSRSLLPMIERSDVCATCPIAAHVVLHVDGRTHRIRDLEVDDGIHAHGHVVAGDAVLGGHGHRDDLHVHLSRRSAIGIASSARAPGSRADTAEPEDDASFELLDDPNVGSEPAPAPGPRSRSVPIWCSLLALRSLVADVGLPLTRSADQRGRGRRQSVSVGW